ncbi:MAG TPA: STM3941 family protein [Bradyrhizobium sp.]|nr:STM3941 family protein [Bradyrhizobium sp.]
MSSKLPDDAEIGYCRSRLLPLIGLGTAMTLLSASVAVGWLPFNDMDVSRRVMGEVGLALFGLATATCVWMQFAVKGPVVLVSNYGIRDLRIANEFILWDSVTEISACEHRGQKFVVLKITPALEQRLFCDGTARALLAANRTAGLDGIVIRPNGLDTDFSALLAACRAHYAAARGVGSPVQRGVVGATQPQWAVA